MKLFTIIVTTATLSFSAITAAESTQSEYHIEKSTYKKLGLKRALPHLFVINDQGQPVYYHIGGSSENFAELLASRGRAEDDDFTKSSWQKLLKLPEVASHVQQIKSSQQIYLVSADPDWFDCTACTIQKDSLVEYASNSETNIVNLYIK